MAKRKPPKPPEPPDLPRCEVHDGEAIAVKHVTWNGQKRWVCQSCLDGR